MQKIVPIRKNYEPQLKTLRIAIERAVVQAFSEFSNEQIKEAVMSAYVEMREELQRKEQMSKAA